MQHQAPSNAPLPKEMRAQLIALIDEIGWPRAIEGIRINRATLSSAISGYLVQQGTVASIGMYFLRQELASSHQREASLRQELEASSLREASLRQELALLRQPQNTKEA